MSTKKISVLIGSLRKDSFNKGIAQEVMRIASPNLSQEILEIGHLTFYNEDLDQGNPRRSGNSSGTRSGNLMGYYSSRPNTTAALPPF